MTKLNEAAKNGDSLENTLNVRKRGRGRLGKIEATLKPEQPPITDDPRARLRELVSRHRQLNRISTANCNMSTDRKIEETGDTVRSPLNVEDKADVGRFVDLIRSKSEELERVSRALDQTPFRYDYSVAELQEWVPRVRALAEQAGRVHVLMNNCYANYGSTNARELAALLERELANPSLKEYTGVIISEADRLTALVDSMAGPARRCSPRQAATWAWWCCTGKRGRCSLAASSFAYLVGRYSGCRSCTIICGFILNNCS